MSASQGAKPGLKLDGKYETEKKIGAGCFGEVWLGKTIVGPEQRVAVKLENVDARGPQLEHEVQVLKLLSQPTRPQGVADLLCHGTESRYRFMVMELLGKSLEDQMSKCNGRFQIQTAVLVADQLLHRIEYLHSKCIVHRDIKPENFMFGTNNKSAHIYVIDFGLSKRYWVAQHAKFRTGLSLTGTARYASINAHEGNEQSRRDDLEAIGHMLFYFIRGSLPWSGLAAKTQEEKYRKICEKKKSTELNKLCEGFPDAFQNYLKQSRNLEFKQRPDYKQMRDMFAEVRESLGGDCKDHDFEWFSGKNLRDLVPLEYGSQPIKQPDDEEKASKSDGGGGGFFSCLCGSKSKVRD